MFDHQLAKKSGLDWLGFTYDIRYEKLVDAIRYQAVSYTYSNGGSYQYPTYNQTYSIPDQVFVRTVATTTANNDVYSNQTDLQNSKSFEVGINYQKLTDARQRSVSYTASNSTIPSNFTGNVSLPAEAGYFQNMDGSLPASATQGTTASFTLGLEYDFVSRNTNNGDNMVVVNNQNFQLYQIFVYDVSLLTANMQKDMNALAGKKVADNPDLFGAFFEKWGTHFVYSVIMGGQASHISLVSSLSKVDFVQSNFTYGVSYNTTTSTSTVNTQNAQYISNSPNCVGNQTGYLYNTITKQCEGTQKQKYVNEPTNFLLYMTPSHPLC